MGGSSVPSSTAQFQQVATGIWGSPEATALAKPILKPALANIKNQQDMLMGFQKGDPEQTRKFFGLPTDAPTEDITSAIAARTRGPQIQMPQVQAASQPPKTAAHGGIMSLDDDMSDPRKFATGGTAAKKKEPTWSDAQNARRDALMQKQQTGKLTTQEANVLKSLNKNYDTYTKANPSATPEGAAIKAAATAAGYSPADAYLGQAGFFGASYDPVTKQFSVTNPYYNQATNVLQGMNTQPSQFGQATDAYNQAISGLQGMTSYKPQDVTGRDAQAAAMRAAGFSGSDAAAAQASRGDIRDIAAQLADVERYNAAQIERTQREQAAQTAGPKSWTDPGVAQRYMNPYQQAVTNQELFEANRQAQMRENQQRSQATQQKAFGGTRAALQESEGRRNLGYLLSDIQDKGAQQAYQSGMGQFSAEQGLGAQVGMSNTQAINQLKQQYMSMGLTEAQANQAAINQASQINAAAQNTAYNNYVAQQLQAQQANQMMDWNVANLNTQNQQATNLANQQYGQGGFQTGLQNAQFQQAANQLNAQNQQQANLANQQAAMQAALANQQAGLSANQQNIGAYGQALQGAQGLGALGTQVGNYNAGLANLWGQAGSTLQGLGQGYFNQIQQNAGNVWGGPTTLANQGINTLAGVGGGQSGVTTQTQKTG